MTGSSPRGVGAAVLTLAWVGAAAPAAAHEVMPPVRGALSRAGAAASGVASGAGGGAAGGASPAHTLLVVGALAVVGSMIAGRSTKWWPAAALALAGLLRLVDPGVTADPLHWAVVAVHLTAAAVWLGGVIHLATTVCDRAILAREACAFGPRAAAAVAAVVATGTLAELGDPARRGLGLLAAKVLLVLVCVGAAALLRHRPRALARLELVPLVLAAVLGTVLARLPAPLPGLQVTLVPGVVGAEGCAKRLEGARQAAVEQGRRLEVSVAPGGERCSVSVAGRAEAPVEDVGAAVGRVLSARGVVAVDVLGTDERSSALAAGLRQASLHVQVGGRVDPAAGHAVILTEVPAALPETGSAPLLAAPWLLGRIASPEEVAGRHGRVPVVVARAELVSLPHPDLDPDRLGGYLDAQGEALGDALGAPASIRLYAPTRLELVPGGHAHAGLAPVSAAVRLGRLEGPSPPT